MKDAVRVSLDALDILLYEHGHLMKLYICLCKDMDAGTGLVGKRRRISEQYAMERIEVDADNGRKRQPCTRQKARSALSRLERLGLIISRGRFVFELPLEAPHFSAQNSYNQGTTKGATKVEASQVIDFEERKRAESNKVEPLDNRRCNPPLINKYINKTPDEIFAMRSDWQPSASIADRAAASRYQFDITGKHAGLYQQALADNRLYWSMERGDVRRSQGHWDRTLVAKMEWLSANARYSSDMPSIPAGNHPQSHPQPVRPANRQPPILKVPHHLRGKALVDWGQKVARFRGINSRAGERDEDYLKELVTFVELQNNIAERKFVGLGA